MEYLCPHISAKWLFTLFILLFKLYQRTILDTVIELWSDSKGIANSVKDLKFDWIFSHLKDHLLQYV